MSRWKLVSSLRPTARLFEKSITKLTLSAKKLQSQSVIEIPTNKMLAYRK